MCARATSTSSQIGVAGRHTGVTHSPTSLRLDRREIGGAHTGADILGHTGADKPAQAPPMSPVAASARHDGEGGSRRGAGGAAGAEAAMAELSPIGGVCSGEEEGGSMKRKRSWDVDIEAEAELKQLLTQAAADATDMHRSMRCKCPVYYTMHSVCKCRPSLLTHPSVHPFHRAYLCACACVQVCTCTCTCVCTCVCVCSMRERCKRTWKQLTCKSTSN